MAETVLAFHLLVIFFLIIGFPLALKINHRGFRFFHSAILAFVTTLSALDLPCPLTLLEELLAETSYEGFWEPG